MGGCLPRACICLGTGRQLAPPEVVGVGAGVWVWVGVRVGVWVGGSLKADHKGGFVRPLFFRRDLTRQCFLPLPFCHVSPRRAAAVHEGAVLRTVETCKESAVPCDLGGSGGPFFRPNGHAPLHCTFAIYGSY